MPNRYYQAGEQRAQKVQALFSRIATRYDLINNVQSLGFHKHWKRRLVQLAQPQPGHRALDLCCGTGDVAFELARRGIEVIGLDFSKEMLTVAERRKARTASGLKLRFLQGDALGVPFEDSHFDVITVGYGLRNLADWKLGLREMRRVARSGGRILVLDFGKPKNPVWRLVYYGYLRLIVPIFGLLFCGSAQAYAYILESLGHYPGQNGVAAHMRDLGLVNVHIVSILGGAMSINYGEKPGATAPQERSDLLPAALRRKIIPWDSLPEWRAARKASGRRLVVTNGCFDLLHPGHVTYLANARELGDELMVGLNGDESVRLLKGEGRPINPEQDRALVLAALESVSAVCVFKEKGANRFLSVARPDIYVKGGDYTVETINQEERRTVEDNGGEIVIIPVLPGKSTTALLGKISKL